MLTHTLVKNIDDSVMRRVDGTLEFEASPPDISHKGLRWVRINRTGENDPVGADQIKEGPVRTVTPTSEEWVWTVRAMTAQEIADRDRDLDNNQVLNGVIDLADVVIALVDGLIAKGTIVATDFPASQRQKYQDLKTIIERLR